MPVSDLEAVCRSEVQRVLTYLRGNRRFGSLSRGWRELEEDSPVRLLNEWRFGREPTADALLAPLLQIVRSPEFAGPSTYVALEASLAVVRALCDQPEPGPLAGTLAQVSGAVVDCVFEETHAQMDEATTAQMISVLRACAEVDPAGRVDTAAFPVEGRFGAFAKILSLWSHYRQSPTLRGCAQEALFRMLDVVCDHLDDMHEFLSLLFDRISGEVDAGGLAAERALLFVRCLQRLAMHPVARRTAASTGPQGHYFQSSVPLLLMSIGEQFTTSISVLSMLLPVINRMVWLCADFWRRPCEGSAATDGRHPLGALQVEALISSVYLRALGRAMEPLRAKEGEKAALLPEEGVELLALLLEALCDLLQADTVQALWLSFDSDWRRPALLEQVIGFVVDLYRDLHQHSERPLPAHVVHLGTTVLVRVLSPFVGGPGAPAADEARLGQLKEQWRRREAAVKMMAKLEDSPKKGRAALEASGLLDFLELPRGAVEALPAAGPREEWAVKMAWVLRCLNHLIPYPAVGEFFGQPKPDSEHAFEAFVETFDCGALDIDQALRCFLQAFLLPKEAQQIDRVLKIFAHTYYRKHREHCDRSGEAGAGYLKHPDAAYTLAFSVILLNSDQHNPKLKRRMTVKDFISNNRGINEGENIPEDVQARIFESIRLNEIKTPDSGSLVHGLSPARWADLVQLIRRGYRDNALSIEQDCLGAHARQLLERVGDRVRLALESALATDLGGHSDALEGLGQMLRLFAGCPEADGVAEGLFFFGMEAFLEQQQRVSLGRASACLEVLFRHAAQGPDRMSTKQLHMTVYLTVQFALYGFVDKVLPPLDGTVARLIRTPVLVVDPPTGVVYSFLRKISTAPFKMLAYAEDGEQGGKAAAVRTPAGSPAGSPRAASPRVASPPGASPREEAGAPDGAQERPAAEGAGLTPPTAVPPAASSEEEPPLERQASTEVSLLDDPLRPQIELAFKASGIEMFVRSLVDVWLPGEEARSGSPPKGPGWSRRRPRTEIEAGSAAQVSLGYLSALFLALRVSGGAKAARDQDLPWWPGPPERLATGTPQGLQLPKRSLPLNVLDGYETLRLALRLTASTLGQRQPPGPPWDPAAVQELSVCAHVGLFHTLRRPDLCERTLRVGVVALFQVATALLVLRSPEGPVVSVGWPVRLLEVLLRRAEAEPHLLVPVCRLCLESVRAFASEVTRSGRVLDQLDLWRGLLQLLLKAMPTPARALWPGTRDREISEIQHQIWRDGIIWVLGHPHLLLGCLGPGVDREGATETGAQEGGEFRDWALGELGGLAGELRPGSRPAAARLVLEGYRSLLTSISHACTAGEYELLEAALEDGGPNGLDRAAPEAPATDAVADGQRLAAASESWARVAIALLSYIGSLGRAQLEEPDLQIVQLLKQTMLSVRVPSLLGATGHGPHLARLVLEKIVDMLTGPVSVAGAPLHVVRDAVSLVAKFFLQNMQTLQRHDGFGQVWLKVLRLMLIFIKRGRDNDDAELEEVAVETLKNLLQVLLSTGVLGFIDPKGSAPDATTHPVWWQMTWLDLEKSLPGFGGDFSRACAGLGGGPPASGAGGAPREAAPADRPAPVAEAAAAAAAGAAPEAAAAEAAAPLEAAAPEAAAPEAAPADRPAPVAEAAAAAAAGAAPEAAAAEAAAPLEAAAPEAAAPEAAAPEAAAPEAAAPEAAAPEAVAAAEEERRAPNAPPAGAQPAPVAAAPAPDIVARARAKAEQLMAKATAAAEAATAQVHAQGAGPGGAPAGAAATATAAAIFHAEEGAAPPGEGPAAEAAAVEAAAVEAGRGETRWF